MQIFKNPQETCRVLIISTISAIYNYEFAIEKPAGKSKKIIWTPSRNTRVSPLKFIHWQLFIGSSGRCFAVWSYKKRLFYDKKRFFYYKKRLFYVLHSMSNNWRKPKKCAWVRMVFCYQNCSDLLWEKNCSSDREKLLKFEAEGREFAKKLRSLEQFIQTVKGQNNYFVTEYFFNLFLEVSHI